MEMLTKEKSRQKRKSVNNQNNSVSYFRLCNTDFHHHHNDNNNNQLRKDREWSYEWVVPPRVAITDRRILRVRDGKVLFSWKNNRSKRYEKMELPIDEFIRRFLLHLLPERFQRIRYYGIFANRFRKENIRKARECIQAEEALRDEQRREDGQRPWEKQDPVWEEILQKILTWKKPNCPVCKQGRLVFAGLVKESPG